MVLNSTVEILDFWTCLFLDPPSGPWIVPPQAALTNTSFNGSSNEYIFYECRAYGKYLAGVDPKTVFTNGHYICVGIFLITLIIGSLGMVLNILNIVVLQKSHKGSTLKDLLVILAIVEWVACFSTIAFSYLIVSILENLNRSMEVYLWFRVANIAFSLSRTGSIYVTILVTIERYLVVAYPAQSRNWLTPLRSRIYLLIVAIFSFIVNLSLIFNAAVSTVEDNDIFPPHTHVENFPYIFKDTHFTDRDAQDLLTVLNYVAPFPLLLVFNILLYKSIYDWSSTRVRLTGSHKREINTAKMLSIVVLILLTCHTTSCIVFYTSRFRKLIFREVVLVQLLCVVVGASVNFIVYYIFSQSFKTEFGNLRKTMNQKFCNFGL